MMVIPVKRVPPPPPIAQNDPVFNRWLHDLTAFIQEGGGVDPGIIPGYDELVNTVDVHTNQILTNTQTIASNTSKINVNTGHIATNTANIATNTANIATNTANISTNSANINTNAANIATLAARSQVLHGTAAPAAGLGVDGDWFADTTAKHIHVKVSGAWVLIV